MADMKSVALLILVVMAPRATYGQAAITGIVSDSSGAALAAVMVEASSPSTEEWLFLDGLNIGSPPSGNSATSYALTPARRTK